MTPTHPNSLLAARGRRRKGEYARGVAATRDEGVERRRGRLQPGGGDEPGYPEAWNGLGFALRNQGKYAESLKAYDQALRLRPDYPDALEYLGEAYVKLGRLEDARRVLERLTPLDRERARELSEAIARGK